MTAQLPTLSLITPPPAQDDFTLFFRASTRAEWGAFLEMWNQDWHPFLNSLSVRGNKKNTSQSSTFTIPETIKITWEKDGCSREAIGRALICVCSCGTMISATLRILSPKNFATSGFGQTISLSPKALPINDLHNEFATPTWPSVICDYSKLSSELSRVMFDAAPGPPTKGLLVIAGQTNCGKSTVVRSLIWDLINRHWELYKEDLKRKVHVLTYEDPIEYPLQSDPEGGARGPLSLDIARLQKLHIDFTQRERGRDASGVSQVLQDALRQTPRLVYIGEVRDVTDWKPILDFAGTGHFVIATTHASTLTETFSRLLNAVTAVTPAAKGFFAQRIYGLVHLERMSLPGSAFSDLLSVSPIPKQLTCVLPAIWRGTPTSIANLISDGLASVLPRSPDNAADLCTADSLGRFAFASQLLSRKTLSYEFKRSLGLEGETAVATLDALCERFQTLARSYDLRGA